MKDRQCSKSFNKNNGNIIYFHNFMSENLTSFKSLRVLKRQGESLIILVSRWGNCDKYILSDHIRILHTQARTEISSHQHKYITRLHGFLPSKL